MRSSQKEPTRFSAQDLQVVKKETLFNGFFKMVKYYFKYKQFEGGWSRVVEREMFVRGRAAAVLPYDPVLDQVVLIEQIRVGALENQHPWQFEVVAGIVEEGESSEDVVRREAVEEAGLIVERITPVTSYYPSSGGCNEMIDVYVGEVDASKAHGIHGLDGEDEDIRVHVLSREMAYDWVKTGKIENGASIIALQWLALNWEELKTQWQK
ncbi:ADP-ribose pyrophosphatase [Vibrio ruber DSM 16370]|uniref:ADP-ribose pyrophosphatase n=1 Tax=Vibrio ruber (strain DSM 16370 / JCM 11486 / BCRC 17186 / CECT 7878 / LMG 23124 / VR1) TaxID=1123498 RepID=A0A1R4L9C8_VIBR1|nr:ADP-ribose diphosphatase [Vibrio ruber]SJN53138.1 ADP-ribose pyrophosphatase [Vibrio ruber DSM 16370]